MALSVGIFRHRSQRPFQQAIRRKFFVTSVAAPPSVVETPGVLAKFIQERAYKYIQRDRVPTDVRWQLHKSRSFTKFVPSNVEAPGVMAAIKQQRKQLGRSERSRFDYRYQLRSRFVAPKRRHEPGYISAIAKLRKQLGRQEKEFDVRWQLYNRSTVSGVFAAPPSSDIGWLVSFIMKRAYGHNIRR